MNTKNLTVRLKLTLSFGILAILILIVSLRSVVSLGDAHTRFADYVQGIDARLVMLLEVNNAVEKRAALLRDVFNAPDDQARSAARTAFGKAHDEVVQRLGDLMKMIAEPGVPADARAEATRFADAEQRYAPVALSIVELAINGKHDEAVQATNAQAKPLLAAMRDAATRYRELAQTNARKEVASSAQEYAVQRGILIAGCALAFAAAAIAGILITRSLTRALGAEPNELGGIARRVADGDLTPVHAAAAAPGGSVLASLGQMQQGLARLVSQVRTNSDSIATASAQIATGNTDLSQRTEEQASNLQQTAASMEQISSTAKTSADTAREANQLALAAASAAEQGGRMVEQVVSTMREISTSSQKIADIIGVIDGIAFQTNILALNAAVEAARAGEQGRGFAVVASEVRTLAQRSADAAKEIKSLIGSSVEKVEAGAQQVDEAGASMTEIVTRVQRVSQMIGDLSNAAVEQSQGVGQVGDAVQQLDQVTQQNAALVEETAAAAESLRNQAAQLAQLMSAFKLDGADARPRSDGAARPVATPKSAAGVAKTAGLGKRARVSSAKPSIAPRAAAASGPAAEGASAETAEAGNWTTF